MKSVLIGRHNLLPVQEELLRKINAEIVRRVEQVPTEPQQIREFVKQLKEGGVEAIVIMGLPINLLAVLHQEAKKVGIELLLFEMKAIETTESEERARQLVAEKPHARTMLKEAGTAKIRVIECVGISRVKEVKVEVEPLVSA